MINRKNEAPKRSGEARAAPLWSRLDYLITNVSGALYVRSA